LKVNFCMFAPRASDQPAKNVAAESTRSQVGDWGFGRSAVDQRPTA
jgi:hypothetical protein